MSRSSKHEWNASPVMQGDHWIRRAAPEALAGVGNRASVVGITVCAGNGAACDYCHKEIAAGAVEFRVEAIFHAELRTLHFHRICHHMWES
jgi:hypothetical protein